MARLDHLALPFFDDRHRALAGELDRWCGEQLQDVDHRDPDRACRALVAALGGAGFFCHCVPAEFGGAREEMDWRWAEELLENQQVLEGRVTGYNKGGLLVQMRNVRGFIPASQMDNTRREFPLGASPDERCGRTTDQTGCSAVGRTPR